LAITRRRSELAEADSRKHVRSHSHLSRGEWSNRSGGSRNQSRELGWGDHALGRARCLPGPTRFQGLTVGPVRTEHITCGTGNDAELGHFCREAGINCRTRC